MSDAKSTPRSDGDADLLVVQATHDREAFGELYDRYYPIVLRYCAHRLFVGDVAEDVTSEVFLGVAREIRRFPGATDEDFRRWIYRIADNACNAYMRKEANRRRLLSAANDAGGLRPVSTEVDPSDRLDWPIVYQEILRLDARAQSLITLRYFEGLSHDQIAAVLNLRAGTVRVALSRTLDQLRCRLEKTRTLGT